LVERPWRASCVAQWVLLGCTFIILMHRRSCCASAVCG
jgi:hypothetical protein